MQSNYTILRLALLEEALATFKNKLFWKIVVAQEGFLEKNYFSNMYHILEISYIMLYNIAMKFIF